MSQTKAQLINGKSATIEFTGGSASAPAVSFTGDTNTGIYSPGADQVAISTNGTGRLFVDTSGRILVGTSSSRTVGIQAALQIERTGSFDNAASISITNNESTGWSSYLRFAKTRSGSNGTFGAVQNNDQLGFIGFTGSSASSLIESASIQAVVDGTNVSTTSMPTRLVFATTADGSNTATERLRIDSSGRVGIGTTGPAGQLQVNGQDIYLTSNGAVTDNRIRFSLFNFTGNSVGAALGYTYRIANTQESGSLVFYTNPNSDGTGSLTERARIDSSGRLLVGTSTSPSAGGWSQYARLVAKGSTQGNASGGVLNLGTAVAATSMGSNDGVGAISFSDLAGNEFASIAAFTDGAISSTSDLPGKLVFSTTADGASSPTEHLRIRSNGDLLWGNGSLPTASNSGILFTNKNYPYIEMSSATDTSARYKITFLNGNGMVGRIETSGSSTSYITTSDYRLKENVTAVTDGITRLQQLNPSRFNFIAEPSKTVDGFLAHEVQTVVPEAISGEKDAVDDDGNPVYQGIDQSKLVPLLTAALQEAVAKIESLEARLTAAGI